MFCRFKNTIIIKKRAKIKSGQSGLSLKPKQIKEGEKTYQFNKPEDVKAYFNDKDYFNSSEEEQKVIIITVLFFLTFTTFRNNLIPIYYFLCL